MIPVDFLIIGGGLAAANAARTLRDEGAQGSVLILAQENRLPYHRPPLCGRFLGTGGDETRLEIHQESFYRDRRIAVRRHASAVSVQLQPHTVRAADGACFRYGKLLIATGGAPRRLVVPHLQLEGVYYLHSIDDAQAIRTEIRLGARRVVIVGAGFIGLESASTLRELGLDVTVLEKEAALFPPLRSPCLSAYFAQCCAAKGVRTLPSTSVEALLGRGRVRAVRTSAGEEIPCDFVIVSIGSEPNVAFLRDSGIALDNGVLVDAFLQSSDPDVYAAGDVANFHDTVFDQQRRIEHWDNATKQGAVAARNMLGQRRRYDDVSMYYGNAFGTSFSFSGSAEDFDDTVARGSLADKSFSLFYLKDSVPRALFSVGRSAEETYAAEALIRYRVNLRASRSMLADEHASLEALPLQSVLVLQGGGCLGAFECGAVRAIEEGGVRLDAVAAVSIGAFNGAIIASHPDNAAAALASFWRELSLTPPPIPNGPVRRLVSNWQVFALGVPGFFRPRWMMPPQMQDALPWAWTSLYDASPMEAMLRRYVDFDALRSSPVRLLISAANVRTGVLEVFDSYVDDITPAHLLASGSLPPGLPWTMVGDQAFWDGGIVSNSPVDLVMERCGPVGKRIFVVDLFSSSQRLPGNLAEVLLRRDEIVYADRMHNDARFVEYAGEFRELVQEILQMMDPDTVRMVSQRPRFIRLMGNRAGITIARIVRHSDPDVPPSQDYDFSSEAITRLQAQGFESAQRVLAELEISAGEGKSLWTARTESTAAVAADGGAERVRV
ncbi:pyridine nucleotide-disulfide oxidoreductase (plasmid) [Cupriavidus sp. USMAHM13]|uniref:FAD-dependent oxidoreductase n=1 Tax=Cupriavidus sp. USMAHM13 TaxID=1389192 RepID=UPI0008A68279|nr:FAD-dependent oxidoreductase [Cupriavidus sp. USMAHM13]AOZ04363.1 pyridine nucleotide-disulfide oxidoreductase [Cupriavidus sp. USMAHM13]